ncbi:hypothetical protein NONO_c15080 [Nocardia nova SH22a]|uniref:Uncharacterized protein n=1 Tax=Nocardia nova SH22a TaxID=1415166 RepID=W5TAX5_9NOCA|nr:hypothetical protein [Nocardia nova]AHH16309.1 hypothetical protein NONO_c15080 [Nocardia nova SH22a]
MRDLSCHTTDPAIDRLFGPPYHGVRLQPLEDGYGWVAYGHPPARRIVAAVVQEARGRGAFAQLRDCVTYMDLCDGMERWWVIDLSADSDGFLCWYARDARYPGAVPITTIAP